MKRKPPPVSPATCEGCGANNPTVTFEGYLVCAKCRRTQSNELSARRKWEDGEVIDIILRPRRQ